MDTIRAMTAGLSCAVGIACICAGCNRNGTDWDAVLDDYEKIVEQTLDVQKRLMADDESAISEMESLNQKYTELGKKLQGARGQLSRSQQKRLESILLKYSKALAEHGPPNAATR